MNWLISANSNQYDLSRSFSDCEFVDWVQGKTKYDVGDTVYIYMARPEQKIKYKCLVEKVKLTAEEIRNDKEYWVKQDKYEDSLAGSFIRLRLLKKSNNELLDFVHLRENGLNGAPQGKIKLNGELLDYIESNFKLLFSEVILEYEINVKKSLSMDSKLRKERIQKAPKNPKKVAVITYVYERSAYIVAEALIRANGVCEKCHSSAPFVRKKDKTPYLEVHHKIRLSDGGDDRIENVLALCPNCHREAHYGF